MGESGCQPAGKEGVVVFFETFFEVFFVCGGVVAEDAMERFCEGGNAVSSMLKRTGHFVALYL